MADPAAETPATPPPASPLQAFLADRDVPCPHCGYSLRGCGGAACPECGRPIELAVRDPRRAWQRGPLLAMLLVWMVASATVHAVRAGNEAYHAAATVPWVQVLTAGPTAVRAISPGGLTPAGTAAIPPAAGSPGSSALTVTGPITLQSNARTTVLRSANVQVTMPRRATVQRTMTWSNVTIAQWVRLGGWSVLAVVGAAGLIVLIWCRRRGMGRRGAAVVLAIAWVGFVGSLAAQAYGLVQDFL